MTLPDLTPTETPAGWVLRGPDGLDLCVVTPTDIRWSDWAAPQAFLDREGAEAEIARLRAGRVGVLE